MAMLVASLTKNAGLRMIGVIANSAQMMRLWIAASLTSQITMISTLAIEGIAGVMWSITEC